MSRLLLILAMVFFAIVRAAEVFAFAQPKADQLPGYDGTAAYNTCTTNTGVTCYAYPTFVAAPPGGWPLGTPACNTTYVPGCNPSNPNFPLYFSQPMYSYFDAVTSEKFIEVFCQDLTSGRMTGIGYCDLGPTTQIVMPASTHMTGYP
jgi:hypothetical protein